MVAIDYSFGGKKLQMKAKTNKKALKLVQIEADSNGITEFYAKIGNEVTRWQWDHHHSIWNKAKERK